jgi:hypothetical protein
MVVTKGASEVLLPFQPVLKFDAEGLAFRIFQNLGCTVKGFIGLGTQSLPAESMGCKNLV